jgi:hypothetical protein
MYGSNSLAPVPAERFQTASRATVLYRGKNATVTTEWFTSEGRSFSLLELVEVERVEQGGLFQARSYELWALVRGQSVRLFRTRDVREFGQVSRALVRAREYAGLI